jgi:hypothetical protein
VILINIAIAIALTYVMVYAVSDSAQKFFYDQVVPGLWWRAFVCAVPLGLLMVWAPFRFDDAFVSGLHWIFFQILIWFVLLHFVVQFHLGHALIVGCVSYLLFAWIVTMAWDSMKQYFTGL